MYINQKRMQAIYDCNKILEYLYLYSTFSKKFEKAKVDNLHEASEKVKACRRLSKNIKKLINLNNSLLDNLKNCPIENFILKSYYDLVKDIKDRIILLKNEILIDCKNKTKDIDILFKLDKEFNKYYKEYIEL